MLVYYVNLKERLTSKEKHGQQQRTNLTITDVRLHCLVP